MSDIRISHRNIFLKHFGRLCLDNYITLQLSKIQLKFLPASLKIITLKSSVNQEILIQTSQIVYFFAV